MSEVEVGRDGEGEGEGGGQGEKRLGLGFLEWEGERGSWLREMMKGKEEEEGEGEDERRGVIDQVAVAENGQVCVVVNCLSPLFFISLFHYLILLSLSLPH